MLSHDWMAIPVGYYAILDPSDPQTMTYWRRVHTTRSDALNPWPAKAWYGPPMLRRCDVPMDNPQARDLVVDDWKNRRDAYLDEIITAILVDPVGAGRRFAELGTRCCQCGRALKDAESKVLGIGPECRRGMDPTTLARYATPQIGQAHAQAEGVDP